MEVVVPEGKTNTFIRSIFAIVFLYVIMSPILSLVKSSGLDMSGLLSNDIDYSEHLVVETKYKIEQHLFENGVEGVNIEIDGVSTHNDFKIYKIYVNLSNLVILKNEEHIDKYKLITELIMGVVDVSEEDIVYG